MSYADREAKRKQKAQRTGRWPSHVPAAARGKNQPLALDAAELATAQIILEDYIAEAHKGSASHVAQRVALVLVHNIIEKVKAAR